MKKIIALLLVTLFLGGAGAIPLLAVTPNRLAFTVVKDWQTLPASVRKEAESLKNSRGYWLYHTSKETYVVINQGQKPTAGYRIEVVRVEDEEGIITVTTREIKPLPGAIVAQVVTYPMVMVKLEPMGGFRFKVVSEEGYVYPQLTEIKKASSPILMTAEGIYLGSKGTAAFTAKIKGKVQVFKYNGKINYRKGSKILISYYLDQKRQLQAVQVSLVKK